MARSWPGVTPLNPSRSKALLGSCWLLVLGKAARLGVWGDREVCGLLGG